ncbi:heavy metal transport/detoxification protein [Brachybacterium vulturis]|uniref:Copper chaperone CopZ n=1 Tax=Brachybacterium vulturis TaxID=2017484 RepID=A0A291GL13_9MICO|nr:copper ion binding protein [Brachybacterium vulturis]ATG51203.1 heavy metal transport/detoxification protein [Brachybacterium vulturis]
MTATPATITHSLFRTKGFSCPSCVAKIEKRVGRLEGVSSVSVKFASGRVEVDHDTAVTSTDDIVDAIGTAGYESALSAL